MFEYTPKPDNATPAPPSGSIVDIHFVRHDSPISFAEEAAAAAFGGAWATPSSHGFVDHQPPHIAAPKTAPVAVNPITALLIKRRRAA